MKRGFLTGKFYPIHRGHIYFISKAATMCDKLYVVIGSHTERDIELAKDGNIKYITPERRIQWLKQLFQDTPHIEILHLDENSHPLPPHGWEVWSNDIKNLLGFIPDVVFSSEIKYDENYKKFFPNTKHIMIDPKRDRFPVSSTLIRKNPYKYWSFIPAVVRPHFVKKILVTGTESCGKTTVVRTLAKIYNTSRVEEFGKFYSRDYLGGEDMAFTDYDFARIATMHEEQIWNACLSANKLTIIDTDAITTQMYSQIYMGHDNEVVEAVSKFQYFDLVLLLTPEVEWIRDENRFLGDQETRNKLHYQLKEMYTSRGVNVVEIGGTSYSERLDTAIKAIDNIRYMYDKD